jgi:ketosteroid isomerase-like protein
VTQQTSVSATSWPIASAVALILSLIGAGALAADIDAIKRLSSEGRWNEVVAATEGRPQSNGADAQTMFLRAVALARLGRADDAIRTYQSLLVVQPDAPEAHNNMAVLLAQKGDIAKARQHFERAVEMRPDYGTALENLADVYTRLGEVTRAKARGVPLSAPTVVTAANAAAAGTGAPAGSGTSPPTSTDAGRATPRNASPAASATKNTSAPVAGGSEVAARSSAPHASSTSNESNASTASNASTVTNAVGSANGATDDHRAAASMIADWAAAWSAKDVGRYLSFYSATFKPASGASRQAWEAQRRQRIEDKGAISVTPVDVQVTTNQGKAEATFKQLYRAGALNSSEKKRLLLVKEGTRWLIAAEDRSR